MKKRHSGEIEFWFDFGSSYSYLTAMRIEELCHAQGIKLTWCPFLLGPLFKEQGFSTSPFVLYPKEGEYMWKEMERRARRYGLAYQKPSHFPQNGLTAARIATAASDEAWLGAFIKNVFRLEFEEGREISDPDTLCLALRPLVDAPDDWLNLAGTNAIKEGLRARTEKARAKGIFGAPSFIVDEELFWGDDRLEEACDAALGQLYGRYEVEKFCDEWLASWTGNEPEKLISFYRDDALYLDPANPEGLSGREAILSYFKKLLA